MAKIIIVPEATDTRNQVNMLIALNKAAGAAIIISQCLHARKEGVEDGTDEGAVRCPDCGATGKSDADPASEPSTPCDHPDRDTCDDSCPPPKGEVTHLCCDTCPDPCPLTHKE